MFKSLRAMIGYAVEGINGDAGVVRDFYFDDRDWTVRHIVVDAGEGAQRRTLMAPISYITTDKKFETIYVLLTQEQVLEHCVDASEEPPVSRQRQAQVEGDPHLRSVKEVLDYAAREGEGEKLGDVCDLLLNEESWEIRALAVRTPEGLVRVAPEQVQGIVWRDKHVSVMPRGAALPESERSMERPAA